MPCSNRVCPLRHEAIQHEVLGANGETLFTDIAWLGAEQAAMYLVLISATHGVEGFAGSAIQHDTLLQLARHCTTNGYGGGYYPCAESLGIFAPTAGE